MTTVGSDDVAAQLEVIEVRARRRMRGLLPVYALAGGLAAALSDHVLDTHHHRDHHRNAAVGLAVVVVSCVLIAAVLVVVKRRRGRLFPYAPLTYGLTRGQRRTVRNDFRSGRPNADPVLAEVERRTADRVVRQSRHSTWFYPLFVALMVLNLVLPDRTALGRSYFAVLLVLVVVAWPFQVRNLRRLRAFPLR